MAAGFRFMQQRPATPGGGGGDVGRDIKKSEGRGALGICPTRAESTPLSLEPDQTALTGSGVRSRICNSRNCFSSTSDGACVKRHWARWVLGNAITSRIDSAPVIKVMMRSRPKAEEHTSELQ